MHEFFFGNRKARGLVASAMILLTGCQRVPYIDQTKAVPHDALSSVADEDKEVQQAAFLSRLPDQLPAMAPPRTPDNPDALEVWPMTLEEAIQIGLENGEVIRVISLGAQGIPISGFEPTPLFAGAGSNLGAGTLNTVYDPAIQETQISSALAAFDAQFTTRFFYGRNDQLINNSFQAGFLGIGDPVPVLFRQRGALGGSPTFEARLAKRLATGANVQLSNGFDWLYSNSPGNTYPSAYTSRTTIQFTQPLLGGTQNNPSGLEANRAPVVIARLNADTSVWRFKSEVMAMVRSIEQQYWALAQQQVQYWSRQQAVELGKTILDQQQAKRQFGTGADPDVAEAEQQLRQFELDYIQATSDLINTERQLRNILGLPPADGRRIVPVTAPTEARLEPDWETCLAQMVSYQPDIVQNQLLVRISELQLLLARNQLLPQLNLDVLYQWNGLGQKLDESYAVMTGKSVRAIDPIIQNLQRAGGVNTTPPFYNNFTNWQIGLTFQMPLGFRRELADVRQQQYVLLRQRAYLQQIVHQTTHALARFFLEVDANYKLLKYAGLAREAAERRLNAQRVFFETGLINIDRYLDAINRWSNAVALEAQYKTSYNTAIAALEEAKGTLLAYNNIAVAEGPSPRKAYIQARSQQDAHFQLPTPSDGPVMPKPILGPPNQDQLPTVMPRGAEAPRFHPMLPAPAGPVGPQATPVTPTIPAGDRAPISSNTPASSPLDAGVLPVAGAGIATPPEPEGETLGVPISLPPLPADTP